MAEYQNEKRLEALCDSTLELLERVVRNQLAPGEWENIDARLRAAGFVVDRRMWPTAPNRQLVVNLSLLREETLQAAKEKAGLIDVISKTIADPGDSTTKRIEKGVSAGNKRKES